MNYKSKPMAGALSLLVMMLLTSCGASPGGGVGEFKTVSISVAAGTTRLESDVLTGNTCAAGVSTGGTFNTDSVDVTVTSVLYPGQTSAGLPVAVDSYTVQYIPNASLSTETPPALASVSGTLLAQSVSPGGKLTVPIAVAPEAMKLNMVSSSTLPLCSSKVFAYFALITLDAVEVGSGTRKILGPIGVDVVFADRN